MFVFIKKAFYFGSLFLSTLVSATSLSCNSMKNQECEVKDHKLSMLIEMNPYFILLVLKQVNVAVVVIILMIHMQKYVFLML